MRAVQVKIEETDFRKVEKAVSKAVALIRKGLPKERVVRSIKAKGLILSPDDVYEVARCRIKAREKFGELADNLFFDEEGLRYSTPKVVAEYRAKRLKCDVIADVSCGVGGQLLFFATHCKKVYGVEINPKRAIIAALNAMALELNNIEIIAGDALGEEVPVLVRDADIIFSDPARPPGEEIRTIDSLEPNPLRIVEKYSHTTDRIAFELPPQMPPGRVDRWLKGEKEYTSLNFKLNRLALYMGGLADCDVSAISLPSEERVTSEDEAVEIDVASRIGSFIYEVDPAVVKAGLVANLIGKIGLQAEIVKGDKRRTLLTSDGEVKSAFLRRYKVVDVVSFGVEPIRKALRKAGAGKVTLRFSLPPSEYWSVRKKLENGLEGDRWVYLFRIGDSAVIAEPTC
ncbi:RNA cap guanine-N2 methyltransferase [Archaeoglobus veneficus]|uniref:RNA cap guanine-N2 methyltransferase n=1 Tax=Archaeoglobus veneficus (strain DSM 11195 / SNP6) TaxID=693661 RepID=F2KSW2_ARCVS|nr:RNA cap guanine-N2 methyltransferase [Archaeoglobus veneficus]AEA47007.1 RNA cap guanine-N2 methyltransferase [Archaeoglobus veneficus SNP6]